MSDLILYITSIVSAVGPITLTAFSVAALYIIGPRATSRNAKLALNNIEPDLESNEELAAQDFPEQLID